MSDDELRLLDRWCAGSTEAGNTLFTRHFASVYRFFEYKVDRSGDADELAQETFLACLRGRDAFRRQSSFRTYVFAIARNTLCAYWRRRSERNAALDFDQVSVASLSTSAGTRLARREEGQRLLAALRALPLEQQLLLELYYWEGFDGDQLAEVFGTEPATIRSRLFRTRGALRAQLDAGGPAAPGDDDLDAWARALQPDEPDEPH